MLVLRRKCRESIVIHVPGLSEPIVITVVDTSHAWAKIGVVAPAEVRVLRDELNPSEGASK